MKYDCSDSIKLLVNDRKTMLRLVRSSSLDNLCDYWNRTVKNIMICGVNVVERLVQKKNYLTNFSCAS